MVAPQLDCIRLETIDNCKGEKKEEVDGITIKHHHLDESSVLERGLGEESLLLV
jgi:hypothetical protein